MRHFARRKDENHKAIVEALKAAGRAIIDLSDLGHGVPDLLVFNGERAALLEIKNPNQKGHKDEFTPAEKEFALYWRGPPIFVVRTPEEAIEASL